jgi:hypothetical protein
MPATAASRLTPYAQELLDNENMPRRTRGRASQAPRRRERRLVVLLGIGALAPTWRLPAGEDLRSSLFGSASQSEPD